MPDTVERSEIAVAYVACDDLAGPEIRDCWQRLETVVPLRGRRFYGMFDGTTYRACVELQPGDDFALERGTIPGGRYARVRLRGEPPEVYGRIPQAFEALAASVEADPTRPGIEHYRRRDEIDLLLPVA